MVCIDLLHCKVTVAVDDIKNVIEVMRYTAGLGVPLLPSFVRAQIAPAGAFEQLCLLVRPHSTGLCPPHQ